MKRHEDQQERPTAGCLSVPLFNQRKRIRMPMTSNPSDKGFGVSNECMPSTSSFYSAQGGYQASSYPTSTPHGYFWNRQSNPQPYQQSQQSGSNRSAPGPAPTIRTCATPLPHPYKPGNTSCLMNKQDPPATAYQRQTNYRPPAHTNERTQVQTKPWPERGSSQMGQHGSYSQASSPNNLYTQPPRPPLPQPSRPLAHTEKTQNTSWRFKPTNNQGSQRPSVETSHSMFRSQSASGPPPQTQPAFQIQKSATGQSLRILTAVIVGMRHWSQFKDRAPYLFEIFATLDSAVTMGSHGSKSFLLRDGKATVQCVYYENEQELPRLIRGQVQRCLGNYDHAKDLLRCVSVRPALPSEQRNAQEAVKACNVEMRVLVKSFSEV
ncbi:spermatogenesis-associated protein 22 [Gadus morhua]|uniref:Spermatogenesis associated 22 n=1 Tax=Gadus morhua TaxID=8049 RepID=A0A8C5AR68_GADMO|nr:spermatogenesis-associated protein 22 [Gadus morhua]